MSPTFDLGPAGMCDQLDGDPDRLDSMVGAFRRNVSSMESAVVGLRQLRDGRDGVKSEGFSAVMSRAHEVEQGIDSAAYYYEQVANAVAGFSLVLRKAQSEAPGHLDAIAVATRSREAAQHDYATAQAYARNVDPAIQSQGLEMAESSSSRYHAADAAVDEARARLRKAAQEVREANDQAAVKVEQASENANIKDSLWDKLARVGEVIAQIAVSIGKFIWENLDTILLVLSIASFFIPGGAVLNILIAVTRSLKVLSTVKKVVETAGDVWEVGRRASAGDLGGAAKKAVSIGVGIAVKHVAGKLGRSFGRTAGKTLFSIDGSGNITKTGTGRVVHELVTKFGPVIKNKDGTLPARFLSRSIHRTTKAITDSTEYLYRKGITMSWKAIEAGLERDREPERKFSGGGGGGGGGGSW